MTFATLDYNLLRPLRALLEERSVTRAAERLHVSQPTMSTALSRLRAHFEDQLLVRNGNQYELTPLGAQLVTAVPQAIAEVDRVLQLKAQFDPKTSDRTFVIAAVDHVVSDLAPALARALASEAPEVRMEFPTVDFRLVNDAPDSLRHIDGAVLPHGYLADQPHLDLFEDEWVCIVDAHSSLEEAPTSDELLARKWVHTLPVRDGMTPARRQLQTRGIDVQVVATTPYFHVVPDLVAGTDRVAVLPERVARRALVHGEIRIVQSPFELDPIRDAFWWHPSRGLDAGHRWLRGVLEAARVSI
ncbi:MAG: LysR family transcriptional regulator [Gulosibacter sp.]|uniref:LysR family transcriptional regulator n=1 Tax=Gulosibacter sp. TaxID=2817531 RepID=UPI003F93A74C